MTRETYKEYLDKANAGRIADDNNPAFLFNGINSDLLSAIAKGEINCQELAKRALENRGQDIDGKWVGFNNTIK